MFKDRPRMHQKPKLKLKSGKTDCNLFSRLYIGCQTRGGSLNELFEHEKPSMSTNLSDGEKLRQGTKSDLLQCFEKLNETGTE